MEYLINIVTDFDQWPLSEQNLNLLRQRLDNIGCQSQISTILCPDIAIDLQIFSDSPSYRGDIAKILNDFPIDYCWISDHENRLKKLLLSDMDSTLVAEETLDFLAEMLGVGDKVRAITDRAMAGELSSYSDSLRARVAMIAGGNADLITDVLDQIHINKGARQLVTTMKKQGAYCALVSGGFTCITEPIGRQVGMDQDFSNGLGIKDGLFTGSVEEPICGPETKLEILYKLCNQEGIKPEQAVTVGDGANDLKMLHGAGLGVAYYAKDIVKQQIEAQINHTDLSALLYFQGIPRDLFAL